LEKAFVDSVKAGGMVYLFVCLFVVGDDDVVVVRESNQRRFTAKNQSKEVSNQQKVIKL